MFLNSRMDEYLTQMVAGYELGHGVFHRYLAKSEGIFATATADKSSAPRYTAAYEETQPGYDGIKNADPGYPQGRFSESAFVTVLLVLSDL